MYAFSIEGRPFRFAPEQIMDLAGGLRRDGYALAPGRMFRKSRSWDDDGWAELASCWERLTFDPQVGDASCWYRRYGVIDLERAWGERRVCPHGPGLQLDPLEKAFVNNPVLGGLLHSLAAIFEVTDGECGGWDIRLHPHRVVAPGDPTPRRPRRGGVDYVATLMVNRRNVVGGETVIADPSGPLLERFTLTEPMDLVIADGVTTMRAVTTLEPAIAQRSATQDALTIAFTRTRR